MTATSKNEPTLVDVPVLDAIAQEFLRPFLKAFAGGDSLYVSVQSARENLKQKWDDKLPGASWLPAICQNQSEYPKKWEYFQRNGWRYIENI
jgi:hypothetical protein